MKRTSYGFSPLADYRAPYGTTITSSQGGGFQASSRSIPPSPVLDLIVYYLKFLGDNQRER